MPFSGDKKMFEGKVVVVTGAASGLGRAHALELAKGGARVWVTDINGPGAEQVAQEVDLAGGTSRAVQLDVSNPNEWANLAVAVEREGPIHGLVNNAGVGLRVGIQGTSIEDWSRFIDTNLSSVFFGLKFMAPALIAAKSASVVNISSVFGITGYMSATYAASKWGIRGLTKTAALEFASAGVRVNSVHPGAVDTPLMWGERVESAHSGRGFVEAALKAIPAGRYASPDEVARVVAFLLSDGSSYMTGTEIIVDGGFTSSGLIHRMLGDAAQDDGSN